jgi:hypothetical protein
MIFSDFHLFSNFKNNTLFFECIALDLLKDFEEVAVLVAMSIAKATYLLMETL